MSKTTRKGVLTLVEKWQKILKVNVKRVQIHELLHGIVPNHGRAFKTLLHMYLPDWENLHNHLTG